MPSGGATEQREALKALLRAANLTQEPERITEMSAGFCNWVYRIDFPGQPPLVAKLFSPLAQLRLAPELRGAGDEAAGETGLGPRLIFRSADGLITDYIDGSELTEKDIHASGSSLSSSIAPLVARLHGLPDIRSPASAKVTSEHMPVPLADASVPRSPILWEFLEAMLSRIAESPERLPPRISLSKVREEVERMRRRCCALRLPVVSGHGDLKPSNVMRLSQDGSSASDAGGAVQCQFIDFELSGDHYRGYDLFKLFRTADEPNVENMRSFLSTYATASAAIDLPTTAAASDDPSRSSGGPTPLKKSDGRGAVTSVLLDELIAEAYAAEPLTWLEAAVFFLFAISVYPSESDDWAPLALQRWERYLASASAIDADGPVTVALLEARAQRGAAAAA